MPKKPVEMMRVPLNVYVTRSTKESITGIQNETRESQGEVVDRAVALLALGEEVAPPVQKKSRREKLAEERAKSDVVAQVVGRPEIDYSDVDSTPTTNVASLDAVGPALADGRGKVALENWRANRKPIPKPGERK
jgi:hypothetical protein